MAIRTLKSRSGLPSLLAHPAFTLCRLKADPRGAPYVARFEALRAQGRAVLLESLDHVEAVAEAQARCVAADERLDDLASRVSKDILTITSDDRTSALYTHYFPVALGELTKPVLGAQLERMRQWEVSLSKSSYAALSGIVPELAARIAEADAAAAQRSAARQAKREFRDVGARQQWVDSLNATRKEVYGALARMPHEDPSVPSDFADQFFMKDSGRDAEVDEDDLESLNAEAEALRAALAEVEAKIETLEASEAEAERVKAAQARKAAKAQLAKLDQAAAELEEKRAALRAELEETPE